MDADAHNFQIPCLSCLSVERTGAGDGHSELVFAQTSRDVGMGVGRHVWIHTKRDPGNLTQLCRALCQSQEFRFALYIEEQNACFQRHRHLVARFSDAGEDDLFGRSTVGGQHPLQFSARNYVEGASLARQQAQNAQIGICFDGIADGVGNVAKRLLKRPQPLADGGCRIDVERRSIALCEVGQGNAIAEQFKVASIAQQLFPALLKNKSRRPLKIIVEGARDFATPGHFRLEEFCATPSLTLIATTVWSSKVSTPAECSAAAMKRLSTTQSADLPPHSAMIFSTRPRPNISPLRSRASRMPSLKNTNMSPGFILNRNSSYSASSKSPRGNPVASITWFFPSCT